MARLRIDNLLIDRGLVETLDQAQRLIMAGQVRAEGQVVLIPSEEFFNDIQIDVDWGPRYVSRGGEKLSAALNEFKVEVQGLICADVGASTGGFTDCLIQHGARKVYAIDVGRGVLHWKLRQDPKVVIMEGINVRYIDQLPEVVDLIAIDVSFISTKKIIPIVKPWLKDVTGKMIVLIKPQFEASRSQSSKGKGVIKDPAIHKQVLFDVLNSARDNGFHIDGLIQSPIKGPKGNKEFLVNLTLFEDQAVEVKKIVEALFP
ncbi:MAG: TlyA family RNA methyltransferase [Chloroflexota bacterium]|nr:MAG: TlyA family RNA methyltransferase [Chloroflexota bacterium]